jgi:UDP-N-acetylmuramate--alanine ligase
MTLDLSRPRSIHIVGIGGPGMSAIAIVLAQMGHRVTGSDLRETPFLPRLRALGVDVQIGHAVEHLDGVELVGVSTAIPSTNLEVAEAIRRDVAVLPRAALLAAICAQARAVAVAGTHGKTSTSSMLALILRHAGMNPSFLIGGELHDIGAGAAWNGPGLLVVEADESDGTFTELPLSGTILTNVDVDHLDHFGTVSALHDGFATYLRGAGEPVVVCADDEVALGLARSMDRPFITYGTSDDADYRLHLERAEGPRQWFDVFHHGNRLGPVNLPVRGAHMARNATGALAMAMELGAPFAAASEALARYGGVARRFEVRGVANGITFVDDYAHLPGEIAAVLEAAATSGDEWRRVVAVFQPNRFSRMEVLSPAYADAFEFADVVVIANIYASGERPLPGVTGKLVVNAVLDAHPETQVVYLPKRTELASALAGHLRPGDVVISMGCGDIATLPDELLEVIES